MRGRLALLAGAVLAAALGPSPGRAAAQEAPKAAPAAQTPPGRRDLGVALRLFEEAVRDRPDAFARHRRAVADLSGRATMAFFAMNPGAAMAALGEARALLEGVPWGPDGPELARLRVELPVTTPAGAAGLPPGARLVSLGSPPSGAYAATAAWDRVPAPPSTAVASAPWGESGPPWTVEGTEALAPGVHRLVVAFRAAGATAPSGLVFGETCVVPLDAAARADAAVARLPSAVPEGTPPGVLPTFRRWADRARQALAGKAGDVVPDAADLVRRMETTAAALAAAAAAGRPWRPTWADLAGDHIRATADGARYRVIVPPPPADPAARPGLVVAVHGAGGSEDLYADGYGAGEAVREALRRGWVLACPDGVGAAVAVAEDLMGLLPVDPARVYLTGHSMGGAAAWRAAFARPDLWAAVSPASAGSWGANPTWSALARTPVLVVTAERDFSRGQAERAARDAAAAGVPVRTLVLPDLDHLLVVQASLPEVFAFFEANPRK